jgi:hypothetical protein
MPIVQFKNKKKFVKALEVLVRTGGTFQGRPDNVFIVGPRHYGALVQAGLIDPQQVSQEKRGAKKNSEARSDQDAPSTRKRTSGPKPE